jgi:hypothetical protein
LKIAKVKSAPEEVFKDPWGKSYLTEKRLLDNIILALKKCKFPEAAVKTWEYPWDKIKEKMGLSDKIVDNPLLDEVERKFIRTDFKEELAVGSMVELKIPSSPDSPYLTNLSLTVENLVKKFKPLKSFVQDLVALRLKCVYGHPDNRTLKKKKKPVTDLIRNIKKTREYLVAFNIGRGLKVEPPFIPPYFPNTDIEYQTCRRQIDEWYASIAGDDMRVRAGLVRGWLIGAISE